MEPIQLPAIFTKMTPRVDKSWKLEIETRELNGENIRKLAERLGTEGWWINVANPTDLQLDDLPKEAADSGMEGKSPSQRLHSVLFVLWKQNGMKGSFDNYYITAIESLIDTIKARLEPSGR